jgi:hypothetical protein
MTIRGEQPTCLDASPECEGSVDFRAPLSGTGRAYPRCDRHWSARLDTQARINRTYPDSPTPPAWFDASAAGETWDEEN